MPAKQTITTVATKTWRGGKTKGTATRKAKPKPKPTAKPKPRKSPAKKHTR